MFNTITKIIRLCKFYEKDIIFSAAIILIAVISFGLGRLSKIRENRVPLTIENLYNQTDPGLNQKQKQSIIASKNGKKYHYAWCDSASGIKDENKIFFSTKEEALAAGYTPAANCKGL